MKKFYSFLFLAVAGLLTFAASAQVKFTVKVDDPSKVVVETGYWSARTPVELTGEETEVEANAYEYVFISAVDGYMLDKVTLAMRLPTVLNLPTRLFGEAMRVVSLISLQLLRPTSTQHHSL